MIDLNATVNTDVSTWKSLYIDILFSHSIPVPALIDIHSTVSIIRPSLVKKFLGKIELYPETSTLFRQNGKRLYLPYYCYVNIPTETPNETIIAHVSESNVADMILGKNFFSWFHTARLNCLNGILLLKNETVSHYITITDVSSKPSSDTSGNSLISIDAAHPGILNLENFTRKFRYIIQ